MLDHNSTIQLTIFQVKNNVPNVESQYIKFSSKLKGFDIKKSDINNDELDLETEDEHFDQGEKIDKSFSNQDSKIPPSSILK